MRSVLMPMPLPELSPGGARSAPLTNQMRLDSEGFFEAKSLGLDIIERNWSVLTFLFFLARARIFLRVYEASSDVLSQC